MAEIVIGIDGGGTRTRVVAATVSGQILATTQAGAANPDTTPHAQANVQGAIHAAVAAAGHAPGDVVGLVAGLAGLDAPKDQTWAENLTALPGLDCPRLHVNDAVVAHAGALQSRPGIIAIAGTGCIIFAVTEAGRHLRNYDFHHYAPASARHLSYEAVYRVLAGDAGPGDGGFVAEVLAFWQSADLAALQELGARGFVADRFERNRRFGGMAPLVTGAARRGTPLARAVCDAGLGALGSGIRLLGNCFTGEAVPVALIGGVAQSDYMRQGLTSALAGSVQKRYQIVDPAFPAEVGAALMALTRHGVPINDTVISALRANVR